MKKYINILLFATLVFVSLFFIYQKVNPKELNNGFVAGSGTVDGDLILLNTKYPARVEKIFVQEGDRVVKKQEIAKLKSDEFLNKQKAVEANINAKNLELKLLSKTLPHKVFIKKEQLINIKKSLKNIDIKIAELRLNIDQSNKELNRNKKLYRSKAITDEKFEHIELKYKTLKKKYQYLEVEKEKLKNSLKIAKTDLQIAKENLSKIDILKQNILSLKSSLNELKSMINELSLCSPVDGYIIEKVANEGEVVGAGGVVVTLSNRDSYYLKLFVDTINNGKIKIGDKAVIFVDAYPDKAIEAKITNISAKAEFTPKEVSVRSDRIQRVYEVHLKPIKFDPVLKLGIPAIGIISIDGTTLPSSLNEIPKI